MAVDWLVSVPDPNSHTEVARSGTETMPKHWVTVIKIVSRQSNTFVLN